MIAPFLKSLKILKPLRAQGLLLAALLFLLAAMGAAQAADLPVAAGSPIAGITFDDRPLLLPVQRNFQMAMLTASSELGRTCGHIEAYGWRMGGNEQKRVDQIFNNTVDRMRAQGFAVESKVATSVSKDVTLFTADREDKHLIFLWSAGEIGLVMVLCETSAPLTDTLVRTGRPDPQPSPDKVGGTLQVPPKSKFYSETAYAVKSRTDPIPLTTRMGKAAHTDFSPLGDWVGTYSCMQGTTGATLQIDKVQGERFEGVFRFYPTPKNPNVPMGKYTVFGEYDRDSQRILINPGKWIHRPPNYYNTIMIGSFDPVRKTFSAFFQGVTGCTSFEATHSSNSAEIMDGPKKKAVKKKAVKPVAKKAAAKKVEKAPRVESLDTKALMPEVPGIAVGGSAK